MIALSTESRSARISGIPMNRQSGTQHTDEDQRRHHVDEYPVDSLGGHRDFRVPGRIAPLTDVAGRRIHGDHVPGDREHPAEIERGATGDVSIEVRS